MKSSQVAARGRIVVMAGLGLNLALGVLYSWSVIAKTLTKSWGWTAGEANLPYACAVGVFALSMVFAGRAQDRYGPRIVASIGGALVGSGLLLAGFGTQERTWPVIVGFGLMAGLGIGLGYACATPAAIKWFPSEKKGLITGFVVAGFGLASVYIAPLTTYLLSTAGVAGTFRIIGAAFLVVTVGVSQFLVNPPEGYVPSALRAAASPPRESHDATARIAAPIVRSNEFGWREMVRTRQFALLWLMYAFSAFAGLMIIGHMAKIAAVQMTGTDLGFLLVAVLAVGNASGRVVAGVVSDRIGGVPTMAIVFVLQAVMMGALSLSHTPLALVPVAAAVGFAYGANLSLFPSTTAGYFGTKNLGVNYGLVFTAWGVGGVFGSMTAGTIVDSTGSYGAAYAIAAILCFAAASLTVLTSPPEPIPAAMSAEADRVAAEKARAASEAAA